jgi:hypothetical protein
VQNFVPVQLATAISTKQTNEKVEPNSDPALQKYLCNIRIHFLLLSVTSTLVYYLKAKQGEKPFLGTLLRESPGSPKLCARTTCYSRFHQTN